MPVHRCEKSFGPRVSIRVGHCLEAQVFKSMSCFSFRGKKPHCMFGPVSIQFPQKLILEQGLECMECILVRGHGQKGVEECRKKKKTIPQRIYY